MWSDGVPVRWGQIWYMVTGKLGRAWHRCMGSMHGWWCMALGLGFGVSINDTDENGNCGFSTASVSCSSYIIL